MRAGGSRKRRERAWRAALQAVLGLGALSFHPADPVAAPAAAESNAGARAIRPGSFLEAELQQGGTERYAVRLAAGRRVRITAAQNGIDVVLALAAGAGAPAVEADRRSSGEEVLLALVPAGGFDALIVRASSDKAPAGRYALVVEELGGGPDLEAAFARTIEGEIATLAGAGKDRLKEARSAFESARDAWVRAGDARMAARCIYEIGLVSNAVSEPAAGATAFAEAERRFAALGLAGDRAAALDELANSLALQGDFKAAVDASRRALDLEQTLTPLDRTSVRFGYGNALKETGSYDEALRFLEPALAAFHAAGQVGNELAARNEVASVHLVRRDTPRALAELTKGVVLSREAGRPEYEARFLQRLGLLYWEVGDEDAAAEQWRLALALHRKVGNRIGEAAVLMNLGDYSGRHGDPAGSEASYRQALEILKGVGSLQGEARALNRLGVALMRRGDYAQATSFQERAVEIARKLGAKQSEVNALLNLGRTRAAAKDAPGARRAFESALALSREASEDWAEEDLLGEIALLDRDAGRLQQALAALDDVVAKLEKRQKAALVPALQSDFVGESQRWYAARTDVLMQRHQAEPGKGWDARAFESAERAKARVLLQMLAEARFDLRRGVEPKHLDAWRDAQVRLAGTEARGAGAAEVAEAARAVQVLEAEIRRTSPAYASLALPTPIEPATVRARLLDSGTVLLEYALGEDRSWLWAVSKEGMTSAALPKASEIEEAAEALHARLSRRPDRDGAAAIEADAARLGSMLLGPVSSRLQKEWRGRRLAVVASGALVVVPFALLPAGPPVGGAPAERLIAGHEVVMLPSATVLDAIRQETGKRKAPARRMALVGDPVFAADDPRVGRGTTTSAGGRAEAAFVPGGLQGFARLPFSREEVQSIASLLPDGEALRALDFRATRELATGGTLGEYGILHFATHGLLNTDHPELSGLVLSLVDEEGLPQDGFLRLQDIYDLHLSADLVVLSACRSALGRRIAGEGLIGLTRGFMHAGAPRVVASLWQVDDSATAELMRRFYSGILKEKLRPAAALRKAQRDLGRDPRFAAPFFWAGFTLEGEWR